MRQQQEKKQPNSEPYYMLWIKFKPGTGAATEPKYHPSRDRPKPRDKKNSTIGLSRLKKYINKKRHTTSVAQIYDKRNGGNKLIYKEVEGKVIIDTTIL